MTDKLPKLAPSGFAAGLAAIGKNDPVTRPTTKNAGPRLAPSGFAASLTPKESSKSSPPAGTKMARPPRGIGLATNDPRVDTVGEQTNPFIGMQSLFSNFMDSASLGFADEYAAAHRTAPAPTGLAGMLSTLGMAGLSAGAKLVGGDGQDTSPEQKDRADITTQAPGYGLAGSILGYVVPGLAEAKAVKALAAGGKGLQVLTESGAVPSLARTAFMGASGAGQGYTQAQLHNESPGMAALLGGIFGAGGQAALGEVAPTALRLGAKVLGSPIDAGTEAASMAGNLLRSETPNVTTDHIMSQLKATGTGGVLADAPDMQALTTGVTASQHPTAAAPLVDLLLNRIGLSAGQSPTSNATSNLGTTIREELAPLWANKNVPGVEPAYIARSKAQLADQVKALRKRLSPEYTALLKPVSTMIKANPLFKIIDDTIIGDNKTAANVNAAEALKKQLLSHSTGGNLLTATGVSDFVRSLREDVYGTLERAGLSPSDKFLRGQLSRIAHKTETATLDHIPGFAKLNEQYRNSSAYLDAHEFGHDIPKMSRDKLEAAQLEFAALPDHIKPAAIEGFTRKISSMMDFPSIRDDVRAGKIPKVVKLLTSNSELTKMINIIAPGATGKDITAAAEETVRQLETVMKTQVGSPSMKAELAAARASNNRKFNLATIGSYLAHIATGGHFGSFLNRSQAAFSGATQRMAATAGMRPEAISLLTKALMTTGSQARAAVDNILAGELPRDRSLFDKILGGLTDTTSAARTGVIGTGSAAAGNLFNTERR